MWTCCEESVRVWNIETEERSMTLSIPNICDMILVSIKNLPVVWVAGKDRISLWSGRNSAILKTVFLEEVVDIIGVHPTGASSIWVSAKREGKLGSIIWEFEVA